MNIVIIVQARMGSTRLPGKVAKRVLGKTLLEYLLERLKRVKKSNDLCVATTTDSRNQPILDICSAMFVKTFRGSEEDVLERYFLAAQKFRADAIVRVTADCPLIDPAEIDRLIEHYIENLNRYDYVADCKERSYPLGMSAEIFSFEALKQAHENARSIPEREHVTPYLYLHPELFHLENITYKENQRDHRWTVDTLEDLQLVSRIIESLYPVKPNFSIRDILNLVQENPEWKEINSHVKQKTLGE